MRGVLGIFDSKEPLVEALEQAKKEGFRSLEVFAPVPDEELVAVAKPGASPVRWFTLLGGIVGGISGLALTIWTTAQWPLLITGGKPLLSIPPFLIIAFELTILLGAFGTVGGFLYGSIWSRGRKTLPHDPRFSEGHFGLWVECSPPQVQGLVAFMKQQGAVEWHIR